MPNFQGLSSLFFHSSARSQQPHELNLHSPTLFQQHAKSLDAQNPLAKEVWWKAASLFLLTWRFGLASLLKVLGAFILLFSLKSSGVFVLIPRNHDQVHISSLSHTSSQCLGLTCPTSSDIPGASPILYPAECLYQPTSHLYSPKAIKLQFFRHPLAFLHPQTPRSPQCALAVPWSLWYQPLHARGALLPPAALTWQLHFSLTLLIQSRIRLLFIEHIMLLSYE